MWYFTKDNTQEGPFDEPAIAATVAAGTISGDTFVWRDGMSEWLPLHKTDLARLLPQRSAPPPLPTAAPPPLSKSPSTPGRLPWFKRTWVHLLLFIFLPYVQVPLMWVLKVFSLRTRIILSVVGLILTIGYFASNPPHSTASSDSSRSSSPAEHASRQEPIYWSEISSIYSLRSHNTDLQKKEEWKRFKGKRVSWSGEVTAISDGFGGLTLQIKMNRDTLTSDLLIRLKRSERSKALRLHQGDSVSFSGKLDDWGTLMPITLNDGELQ